MTFLHLGKLSTGKWVPVIGTVRKCLQTRNIRRPRLTFRQNQDLAIYWLCVLTLFCQLLWVSVFSPTTKWLYLVLGHFPTWARARNRCSLGPQGNLSWWPLIWKGEGRGGDQQIRSEGSVEWGRGINKVMPKWVVWNGMGPWKLGPWSGSLVPVGWLKGGAFLLSHPSWLRSASRLPSTSLPLHCSVGLNKCQKWLMGTLPIEKPACTMVGGETE